MTLTSAVAGNYGGIITSAPTTLRNVTCRMIAPVPSIERPVALAAGAAGTGTAANTTAAAETPTASATA